ncbi:glycoside hydrolase family 6 protein [Paenibacillus sp. FA6]|uniref:glycoside hydrolase family 6 protein n=1 Tax=Paenibacillus sp. FA6 TaxID=3413029 RepID=UPI003F65C39A
MTNIFRKKSFKLFVLLTFLITTWIPLGGSNTFAAEAHVNNPFVGATQYVNPDYADLIDTSIAQLNDSNLIAQMNTVKTYPTAIWLDRIAAIYGGEANGGRKSLEQTLDHILTQKQGNTPIAAMFVIYDLPGRDCHALASNGELPLTQEGLQTYKTDYIDVIADIFSKPKYDGIRIVSIIEPDSLPNLVTNLNTPACAAANSTNIYRDATQYALDQLHAIPNVYTYMDIGHSGWLGWSTNLQPAVDLFTTVVNGTTAGLNSVDGFITNTANTTPTEEPNLPNADLSIGGQPLRSADYYEWNPYFDEVDFTAALYSAFVAKGWPTTTGFLIDTSRNGWGGTTRPTSASGSTPTTYADSGRIDQRLHRGNWCNASGAGMGIPPTVAPSGYAESHLDAFVWVKPPGESDGSSSAIPNNEGKGFDRMCDPTYTNVNGTLTDALPNAPVSGHWFHDQFVQLVTNAFPVIPGSGGGTTPQVPAKPTALIATSDNAKVSLSWSVVTGASSYTVKRATISSGPYTDIATNVTSTDYVDSGVVNETTYYYVVSATNGVGSSANSAEVTAIPIAGPTNPTVPTSPIGLIATAGDTQVGLSWTTSTGATSYTVKRATANGGPYTNIAMGITDLNYVNSGLTNGITYYYVVSAVNSEGESLNSDQTAATPENVLVISDLNVQYKTNSSNTTGNTIQASFNVVNSGATAVNLSNLKLRYYFTNEGSSDLSFWCDWAQMGTSHVSGSFATINPNQAGADTYLEISFGSSAGSIPAGGQSGDIQIRVAKNNWSNFDFTNDYSFNGTLTNYTNWNKVTLHQSDTLVWGVQP